MKRPEIGLFLLTAMIVAVFWLTPPGRWSIDEASDYQAFYAPVARSVLDGRGFVMPDGAPAVRYPPGFPVVLAALFGLSRLTGGSETFWLRLFTLLSLASATLLLYKVTELVAGRRRAMVAGLLWTTYPLHLWLAKQPNSEVPFLPVFFAAMTAFASWLVEPRPKLWVIASGGALCGCAMLLRPMAILLPLAMAVSMILVRGSERWGPLLRRVALLIGVTFLVVLPWEVWAHARTGRWIPLSSGGGDSMRDGLSFALVESGYRRRLEVPSGVRAIMAGAVARHDAGRLETARDVMRFLAERFSDDPLSVVRLYAWKAARSWYGTDAIRRAEGLILPIQVAYVLVSAFGARLLWHEGRSGRRWVIAVSLIVLSFWGLTTISLSIVRYMIPSMALLFPGAAASVLKLMEWRMVRGGRSA